MGPILIHFLFMKNIKYCLIKLSPNIPCLVKYLTQKLVQTFDSRDASPESLTMAPPEKFPHKAQPGYIEKVLSQLFYWNIQRHI